MSCLKEYFTQNPPNPNALSFKTDEQNTRYAWLALCLECRCPIYLQIPKPAKNEPENSEIKSVSRYCPNP